MTKEHVSRFKRKITLEKSPKEQNNELEYEDDSYTAESTQNKKRNSDALSSSSSTNSNKVLKKNEVLQLMDENRELVQSKAISSDNKGYKLLEKFGYSSSQGGLGKLHSGLQVPLIVVKRGDDRSGIGLAEEAKKQVFQKEIQIKRNNDIRDNMVHNFKSDIISQQKAMYITKSLVSASKVIYELDIRAGVTENKLWPTNIELNEQKNEDSNTRYQTDNSIEVDFDGINDDMPIEENVELMLKSSLQYLKETYCYCFYCGCQYKDVDDYDDSCPGPTEDDH